MPIPFEVDLVYSYLEKLGLPIHCSINYIQNSYVGLGLSQKIDVMASNLKSSILNTIDEPEDMEKEHKKLQDAYNAIVSSHYEYNFGRHWQYKLDDDMLPNDLEDRFKNILSAETDLLDVIKLTDNEMILNIVENANPETLRYLNTQTIARLFVYYYENPHNWGFY